MLQGLAVFRWGAWLWMAAVLAVSRHDLQRPWLSLALVGAAPAVTGADTVSLVARGHTYREIGDRLYIAEKTVENHVRNILGKLHLNRKQELIRYALEHGIE